MENLLQDLRFGFRQLLKHPFFTLTAVVALGLGISAVTTQFSVVNGLFLKGLPFPESHRLAHLERINVQNDNYNAEVPIPEYLEWARQQTTMEDLAAYYVGTANLTIGSMVKRYDGCFITSNSFNILGTRALLGRTLQPTDGQPDSDQVMVISHRVWANDLNSDPEIIGRAATLNGRPVTIVGVMPEGFSFPVIEDIWVPLFDQQERHAMGWGEETASLEVFGRLKDGVSYEQARSNMAVIAAGLEEAFPETQKGFRDVQVRPFLQEFVGNQGTKSVSAVMFLITILILIIACANVANLLLARSTRRQKEVAIRSALGASRSRIVRQFLTESILIAVLGALAGLVLTLRDVKGINAMLVEMNSPYWMNFSLDWRVFMAVVLVTLSTGILSGLFPAYRASRLNEGEILKDDSRTSSSLHIGKFSKALVVVQISVAAVILSLVVLFTKSVTNAIELNYTYNADQVMSARIGLFEKSYPDEQSRANLISSLLEALRARPEIVQASTSHRYGFLETPGIRYTLPDEIYTDASQREICRFQFVSPHFLETVQLPLLMGSPFQPQDFTTDSPRKVLVNRNFAEREWPGQNPVGRRFTPYFAIEGMQDQDLPQVEVIGVVENMDESGAFVGDEEDGAAFLAPQTVASTPSFITILARTNGDPAALPDIFRKEISKLDSNLPIYRTGTPRLINDKDLLQLKYFSSIFRQFGILAALLAAVGIYGVITFSVNQRIMEFGIRQALGATRSAVFKLVFGHALKQLTMGFLIALFLLSPLILSPAIKETLAIFFYKIDHNSVMPYLLSFGFVTVISMLAAVPPAYRASRIQPAQALRYE